MTGFSHQVHFCLSCTAKNRVAGNQTEKAKCGKCHKPIYPDKFYAYQEARAPTEKRRRFPTRLALLISILLFVFYVVLSHPPDDSASNKAILQKLESDIDRASNEVSEPPPVFISQGIVWNKTTRPLEAPLSISVRGKDSYFVKLIEYPGNQDAVAIYVPSERTVEVKVPLGVYEIKYAAGETWRGESFLFGTSTYYSKALELFDFRIEGNTISGYGLELFPQSDGNLRSDRIPASEF